MFRGGFRTLAFLVPVGIKILRDCQYMPKLPGNLVYIRFHPVDNKLFELSFAMEKCEIQALIRCKSERITVERNAGKSNVWKHFVILKVDGECVGYVKCVSCDTLLKWKSRDGTSGLQAHTESCTKRSTAGSIPPKLTDLKGVTYTVREKQSTVPASVKSELTDDIVTMCATDIRSVSFPML